MNAWTGKGLILAILISALPLDAIWLVLAAIASLFGTVGLAIEAGMRNPLAFRRQTGKQERCPSCSE